MVEYPILNSWKWNYSWNTFYSSDDNQNKTHDKKEKKMVVQKPHGTMEYTVSINRKSKCFLILLNLPNVSPWHILPLGCIPLVYSLSNEAS